MKKMKVKIKDRSHRYDLNRARSRHGPKYIKYKKCLSMMMLPCNKQQLSNIWKLMRIHEKFNAAWKLSKYEVISGPYFPVFGLNMDI